MAERAIAQKRVSFADLDQVVKPNAGLDWPDVVAVQFCGVAAGCILF